MEPNAIQTFFFAARMSTFCAAALSLYCHLILNMMLAPQPLLSSDLLSKSRAEASICAWSLEQRRHWHHPL